MQAHIRNSAFDPYISCSFGDTCQKLACTSITEGPNSTINPVPFALTHDVTKATKSGSPSVYATTAIPIDLAW